MHLERTGFRDAVWRRWRLQIDVERRDLLPTERIRHLEMITGEPHPLIVLDVGRQDARRDGETDVTGHRDGLAGDELGHRPVLHVAVPHRVRHKAGVDCYRLAT